MKKKKWLLACAMMFSMTVHAQWHIGVSAGGDYNVFTMNNQYQSDWTSEGRWGGTFGIMGQYDVLDWLGIRADLNWTQKNYRRPMVDGTWLTPQFASQVGYLQTVEDMFCNRYPGQWDGGQLMTTIHNWAKTQNTKPIIFVYSYNDPWTGAAIEDAAADPSRKVWKVLRLIGTHSGDFLDPYHCEDQASQAIKDAINSVLGL